MIKKNGNLKLVIDEILFDRIAKIGMSHYPIEFGGFLVGNYSEDFKTLFVKDHILPNKYDGHPTIFKRSTEGLKCTLEKLFDEKNQYYIGEWHTHPNGSTRFSQTDLSAMVNIANDKNVFIKNPILLILSVDSKALKAYSFYIYKENTLKSYD